MRTARLATIVSMALCCIRAPATPLSNAGPLSGPSGYDGLVEFEASRRFGLPDPTDRRLVEFGDDAPRDDLFVMNDLAASQDRRARDVRRVETLQPFGGRVLHDIFCHFIDAGRGVHRTRSRRGKARIVGEFRIAGRAAEAVPFGIRDRAGGDVSVAPL